MDQRQSSSSSTPSSISPPAVGAEGLVLSTPDSSGPRERWLWAAVLLIFTAMAYLPAINSQFLQWDDPKHVTSNRLLRSSEGLWDIWVTSTVATDSSQVLHFTPQYYPLTHTLYWLEYQLWEANPLGYHLVNVLLHVGNALLLWMILRQLRIGGAWLAAAIFVLHPLQVESVAWVSETKNLLSLLFYLLSVGMYLRFAGIGQQDLVADDPASAFRARGRFYAAALALFLCALLSKTVACTMPGAMLLLLWWKRKRLSVADLLPLVPFVMLGLGLGGLTAWLEKHRVGAVGPDWDLSLPQRALVAGNVLWFYAGKLFWPANLTFSYPRWAVDVAAARWYLAPLATLGVVGTLWALRRRVGKGALVGVLMFIGLLVPALGFFNVYPMRYSFVADHFQYYAGIALIVLVVAGLSSGLGRWVGSAGAGLYGVLVASALLLLVLGVLANRHARLFADDETLWRDTLEKNPDSWLARYNLGLILAGQADELAQTGKELARRGFVQPATQQSQAAAELRQQAAACFQRTVELRPQHDGAQDAWGRLLLAQGQVDEAIEHYRKALSLKSDSPQTNVDLAVALAQQHHYDLALTYGRKAVELEPQSSKLHFILGGILRQAGQDSQAAQEYVTAVKLAPRWVEARLQFAQLLQSLHQGPEEFEQLKAVVQIQEELERKGDQAGLARNQEAYKLALCRLGFICGEQGNYGDAAGCFIKVLQLDPNNAEARRGAGLLEKVVKARSSSSSKPSATTAPQTRPTSQATAIGR